MIFVIQHPVEFVIAMVPLPMLVQSVIGRDGHAASAPPVVTWPSLCALILAKVLLFINRRSSGTEVHNTVHQPALTEVLRIDHTAIAQFHALAGVVYPCEIDIERGLDNSKHERNGVPKVFLAEATDQPVQNVEGPVGTQTHQVVGIDHSGDGGLTQEKELGQNTDGFEDNGESPANLEPKVSLGNRELKARTLIVPPGTIETARSRR